jgi:hypothetical protein
MICRAFITPFLIFFVYVASSQTLDGNAVFNFMGVPSYAHAAALGGRNVSQIGAGAGFLSENPALLRKDHDQTIFSNFTFLAPGVIGMHGLGAWNVNKIGATFGLSITHFSYGNEPLTDAAGNVLGTFRAFDQLIAVSGSANYGKYWHYGGSLKFIHAAYGAYRSSALAMDIGLNYYRASSGIQWGFAAKNMGFQLSSFAGQQEDLPFDLVVGVTKKLEKAPFSISLTAQKIHNFEILYSDTAFNRENFGTPANPGLAKQIMSHLILGTDIYIGEKIILSGGFNLLRRNELAIRNIASGLTGFSYGLAFKHKKLAFNFSRSHNQRAIAQQQLSFAVKLSDDDQK